MLSHQYAVMELGASHQGEIDYTSNLGAAAGGRHYQYWYCAFWVSLVGVRVLSGPSLKFMRDIASQGTSIVPAADDFAEQISKRFSQNSV